MARPVIETVVEKVVERDLGYNAIKAQLLLMKDSKVEVGLPADGQTSGRYAMSLLITAADDNEFGKTVPERSFMRSAVDENRLAINEIIESSITNISGGFATVHSTLNHIGLQVQKMIQRKILTGPYTPLHPSTIARKGHALPLVETGQLISSMQYKIRIKASARTVSRIAELV